jgi:uncharacterized protein involved in type VI secretion and phage assembly
MSSPLANTSLRDDRLVAKLAVSPPGYAHAYLKLKLLGGAPSEAVSSRLRLVGFSGNDGVSTLFEIELELHGNTDPKVTAGDQIRFAKILGQPATVGVVLPSEWHDPGEPCCAAKEICVCPGGGDTASCRCSDFQFNEAIKKKTNSPKLAVFNGIIASFSMAEPGKYMATLRPALWTLQLTNRYRILRKCNIRDAIKAVLDEHGILHDLTSLDKDDFNPAVSHVQDWFQAGESDLAFIMRLMEKANLFYYFVHTPTTHCVVISNLQVYRPALPPGHTMRYTFTDATALGLDEEYVVTDYRYQRSLSTSGVNALFDRQQSTWEVDPVAQETPYVSDAQALPPGETSSGNGESLALPFNLYRIYEYGLSAEDVDRYREQQDDMRQTAASGISGGSRSPLFRSGHVFTLTEAVDCDACPPRTEDTCARPELNARSFVLTSVRHEASLDGTYKNSFEATEITTSGGLVTPFNIQQTRQGSVLARVVGTTAPTDWRYLEKSDFDPTNSALATASGDDEVSARGAYVELSTDRLARGASANGPIWVKLASHMQTCPQVGALVLIGRSSDESDLPEIQTVLDTHGSYTVTPSGWTANTSVGGTYSTSYGDSKNIRYGQASATNLSSAVARIESSYASGQFREVSYSQGGSYSYSTADAGVSGMLSTSESIGNTFNKQQAAITESQSTIGAATSVSDITTNTSTSKVGTSTNTDTVGVRTSTSKVGTSTSTDTIGAQTTTSTIGVTTSTNTVGTSTSSSVTGTSTSASTVGVNTSTNTIGVTTSTDAIGVSTSLNATGVGTSLSAVGVSTQLSAVGVSTQLNATGISTQLSATGVSTQLSATGVSAQLSATGVSAGANVTGVSAQLSATGVSARAEVTGASVSGNIMGASVSNNATLASVSNNATLADVADSFRGVSVSSSVVGASVSNEVIGVVTSSRVVGVEASSSETLVPASVNVHGTTTTIKVPGITITLDAGLELDTLTLKMVL